MGDVETEKMGMCLSIVGVDVYWKKGVASKQKQQQMALGFGNRSVWMDGVSLFLDHSILACA
jgi:hypothetical protein